MKFEHSAAAVVFRNGLYLVLQYDEGHWGFVKGHIEDNESEIDTVRREAEEETGISDLEFVEGFKTKIHYDLVRDGEPTSKDVVFYLASTKTSEVVLSQEHKDFAWLSYENALERLTFENTKKVLRKAHEYLAKL